MEAVQDTVPGLVCRSPREWGYSNGDQAMGIQLALVRIGVSAVVARQLRHVWQRRWLAIVVVRDSRVREKRVAAVGMVYS